MLKALLAKSLEGVPLDKRVAHVAAFVNAQTQNRGVTKLFNTQHQNHVNVENTVLRSVISSENTKAAAVLSPTDQKLAQVGINQIQEARHLASKDMRQQHSNSFSPPTPASGPGF